MLSEINKELLNEMGIRAIGDVISILKHVKKCLNNGNIDLNSNNKNNQVVLKVKLDLFKFKSNFRGF